MAAKLKEDESKAATRLGNAAYIFENDKVGFAIHHVEHVNTDLIGLQEGRIKIFSYLRVLSLIIYRHSYNRFLETKRNTHVKHLHQ